jgi:hypothetical protein
LKKIPFFGKVEERGGNLKQLADLFKYEIYEAGSTIITQGEFGDSFKVVVEGDCEVHVNFDSRHCHHHIPLLYYCLNRIKFFRTVAFATRGDNE